MVTGIVVREVDGCSGRSRELFKVQKSLVIGAQRVSRVRMRTSTNPTTAYTNTGGRSLLRSFEKMHTEMSKEIKALKDEIQKLQPLQDEVKILRPLRETAVDIRRRFFATFRRDRVPVSRDNSVIISGDKAAHAGDLITDVSLFRHQFIDCNETFKELYGLDWGEAEALLGYAKIVTVMNKRATRLADRRRSKNRLGGLP